VDFDANLAVARAALAAGAARCGLVSAMGASSKSRVFYSRVKGELEDALTQLPFRGLVIARPSLLLGDRQTLGQPERPLEKAFGAMDKIFGSLIPSNYRPIAASQVAHALLKRTPEAEGRADALVPHADAGGDDDVLVLPRSARLHGAVAPPPELHQRELLHVPRGEARPDAVGAPAGQGELPQLPRRARIAAPAHADREAAAAVPAMPAPDMRISRVLMKS